MKKGMINIFCFPLIFTILISLIMPFNVVHADSNTYDVVSGCVTLNSLVRNNTVNYGRVNLSDVSSEYRAVSIIQYGGYASYIINTVPFTFSSSFQTSESCNINSHSSNAQSSTVNGVTYYYTSLTADSNSLNASNFVSYVTANNKYSNYNTFNSAIYYTFGDGAVAPEPPGPVLVPGALKTGYNTEFVSNGTTQDRFNKDIITWDNYDTNGNLLDNLNYTIELRAIPGYYTGSSKIDLLDQTIVNWIRGTVVELTNGQVYLEPVEYYTLWRGSPSVKKFEILWGDVVNAFSIHGEVPLVSTVVDEVWYKWGWRYEIRYLKGDLQDPDYTSDWQVIYQVTSVDPDDSDTILNTYQNGLSPELYNLLQTVNTLNNTIQNWNINGLPIDMQPNQEVQPDNSWIEILIKGIADVVGNIVDTLGDLIGAILGFGSDIIESLFNMITELGVNVVNFFRDLIDSITSSDADIDLTLPEFNIGENDLNALGEFKELTNAYVNMYIQSGLGLLILIPLVLFVLGVIF